MDSRVIICEDNNIIRNVISEIVKDLVRDNNFMVDIHEFPSYPRAEGYIKSSEYQSNNIFILDIELGEGKNGIELGREIRTIDSDSKIIYLSNHIEMTYDVFKYNLGVDNFIEKNDNFKEQLQSSILSCIKSLIKDKNEKKITVSSGATMHSIKISEIMYIETVNANKKLRLVTKDKIIEFYGALSEMIDELDDRFILSHRANIVNVNYIREANYVYTNPHIKMDNGSKCLLSRSKIKEVKNKLIPIK